MKIAFISDLHIANMYPHDDKYRMSHTRRQADLIDCITKINLICTNNKVEMIIILGDIFNRNIVSPSEVFLFNNLTDLLLHNFDNNVFIIPFNHKRCFKYIGQLI